MKKAILVGVNIDNDETFEESLKELKGLAKACEFKVVGTLTQNLKSPNKKFFIGQGKIETLKNYAESCEANIIIFDNELSPLQYKNLEEQLEIEVIDRTLLILNIFSSRAKTKEAKLQVEVARLNYLLPRLVVSNANYEQQGGGSLHNRGSGEKQIDIDKRILRTRIAQLEKELDYLAINKETQNKRKIKNSIPLVSIVGYTNAGKSTLMNAFIEEYSNNEKNINNKTVLAKDLLFATLDTSSRHIKFKDNKEIILTDTVGFISKLPHGLIRAFKSTLSETLIADLIILVADISSSDVLNQIQVTLDTLHEIGVSDETPIIYVFNKADKVGLATIPSNDNKMFISAKNHLNLNLLEHEIKRQLFKDWKHCKMFIPYKDSSILSYLNNHATIIDQKYEEDGTMIELELSLKDFKQYLEYIWVDDKN